MSGLKKLLMTGVGCFGLFSFIANIPAQPLNLAPDCTQAVAEPNLLWPKNNKFQSISIVGVSDPDNDQVTIKTQCILQDEPVGWKRWWKEEYDAKGLNTASPSVKARAIRQFFSYNDWSRHKSKGRVYDIVFKAIDSKGAKCVGKVTVKVPRKKNKPVKDDVYRFESVPGGKNCDAKAINNRPVIYSQPVTETRVAETYHYTVKGHDPDSDTLTYQLIQAPQGMQINATTGDIHWVADTQQEGLHEVKVRVIDSGKKKISQSYQITVLSNVDKLSALIVANPTTGSSPLTVRFSPEVKNNNIVIQKYSWDFNGDGTNDVTDTFGAPKSYTYTGIPGDTFDAKLTVTLDNAETLEAVQTISIENDSPQIQVTTNVNNGHAPLQVNFIITGSDPQGIKEVSIDYEGDGVFDETQSAGDVLSGSWNFTTSYVTQGIYTARAKIVDIYGAESIAANNAITVDVNNPLDPVIELIATPDSGQTPLAATLTATATLYDGSAITDWQWDLDGDGIFETPGGNAQSDTINTIYQGAKRYYPMVEVTTDSQRKARASVLIVANSTKIPTLQIPNSSDTINSDNAETASFTINLPYETPLSVWIENSSGSVINTLKSSELMASGEHSFTWDASNGNNETVVSGDYYVVLSYIQNDRERELDLRATTGGRLTYYRRTSNNPRTFDRLEQPLVINYGVDDPAEVTFFWQLSFGQKLMTLMEHERMGRGSYSLYWNGEYPNGKKVPDTVQNLMPGIVRYNLPDNVIFVKQTPQIESYSLSSTMIADPRREPIGIKLTLSKASTIELIVADMGKGVNVATRVYSDIPAGDSVLHWDGKNDQNQLLFPGDYRIGVRSVDEKGNRSLFWYRTQRIDY